MGEDVVNVGIALFEQGRNRVTGVDDDMNPRDAAADKQFLLPGPAGRKVHRPKSLHHRVREYFF